jgi:2,5-diketo-D-gluconate reductase A
MKHPTFKLHNNVEIPVVGAGTWQVTEGPVVEATVRDALGLGYRHIDTAAAYRNEAGVGAAIATSGIPRDQVFVTTKLWNSEQGFDSTLHAFERSLDRLGMDHVDLYLIHWPVPGAERFVDTWRAFERIHDEGRARTIGRTDGLAKVIIDEDGGAIRGVGLVGPHASDLISEASLALEMGAVAEDLAATIHPHPTLSEALMEATEAALSACVHLPRT